MRVGPDFILVFTRGVDDAFTARLKGFGDGVDDWADEWSEQREDKYGERLGDAVDQSLQAGDFLDDGTDRADNLVSKHEDGVDLGDCLCRVKIR